MNKEELNLNELGEASGGKIDSGLKCPNCGSADIKKIDSHNLFVITYKCNKCGNEFQPDYLT